MDHIGILKKAWKITWRYKTLWLLGLFAGVTGPGGGGVGSGGGGGSGFDTASDDIGAVPGSFGEFMDTVSAFIPLIIAVGAALLLVGLVWWALSIAARGGLVAAVDAAESGREVSAGAGWAAGFGTWGRVFLLELVLGLPVFLAAVTAFLLFLRPIAWALVEGGEPGPGVIPALCGGVVVLLLLLPVGVVLGVLRIVGLRYAVLEDMGAFGAIAAAWGAVRHRIKDTALMYLVNWGVNVAVGLIIILLMTPVVGVAVVAAGIGIAGGMDGPTAAILIVFAVIVLVLLMLAYSSVWGAYTSAMWTIWWRRLTGREVLAAPGTPLAAPPPPAVFPLAAPAPPSPPPPTGAPDA